MKTYTLTNDKAFRKIIKKIDEEKLRQFAWEHISPYKMRITLEEYNVELAYFLFDFEYDFSVQPDQDYDFVTKSVQEFLHKMHREEIKELYRDYTGCDVMRQDLMELMHEDRIELIADIWNWDKNEVARMDLILAN